VTTPPPAVWSVLVIATAAALTALLPSPPVTPPAVPAVDRFEPAHWTEDQQEEPLYPRLLVWEARGPTPWRVGDASSAWIRAYADGAEQRLDLKITGELRLDAAKPQDASGALLLTDHGGALESLGARAPLEPRFSSMGSLPRPGHSADSDWAWDLGGLGAVGRVSITRAGADSIRLRGEGPLGVSLSGPSGAEVREKLAAAFGSEALAEEIGLMIDVHLTR
jgi:hypothetical protein